MRGFVLHPGAHEDLEEIWGYVAEDDLDAADRLVEEIYQVIRALVTFPRQGHRRPDLTSKPLRFQVVREFLIAYMPEAKPLAVVAILHGRRHPQVMAALLRFREESAT